MKEFKLQKELSGVDQTDHKLVVEAEQAAKSPKFTNSNGGLGLAAEQGVQAAERERPWQPRKQPLLSATYVNLSYTNQ